MTPTGNDPVHGPAPRTDADRARRAARGSGRRWTGLGLCLLGGLAGAALSFDFGLRAGGPVLALIAALNGALFSSMVIDALVSPKPRDRQLPD